MNCKGCNGINVIEIIFTEDKGSPHYGEYRCQDCDRQNGFIKKPENEGKRSDKNLTWRKLWKDKGEFLCAMCGIRESDMKGLLFDCDHIRQLEDGGKDEFSNTMMLCNTCHTMKTGLWKRTKKWRILAATIWEESGFDREIAEVISRGERTARRIKEIEQNERL